MNLPPNTYAIDMRFIVTLPDGETPDKQDPTLVITGEEWNPWPGVEIHDAELLRYETVPPSIDPEKCKRAEAAMRRQGLM